MSALRTNYNILLMDSSQWPTVLIKNENNTTFQRMSYWMSRLLMNKSYPNSPYNQRSKYRCPEKVYLIELKSCWLWNFLIVFFLMCCLISIIDCGAPTLFAHFASLFFVFMGTSVMFKMVWTKWKGTFVCFEFKKKYC